VLAYNPGRAKAALKPEQRFGTLVIETNMDATEVFVDGKTQGIVNKGTPLRLPGLAPGAHGVQGVHIGYEPDGPRQEAVYPGQETLVTIRIAIPRRKNRSAVAVFEKGLTAYNDGGKQNYEKASGLFRQALDEDPAYSQAALYLGRAYNALFDQEKAAQFYRKAIELDPGYTEARASYGGMLLDRGDYDESIRQLNAAVQKEPGNGFAWYLMSVAFSRKEAYSEAVRAARESIRLAPAKAETHFWLAEALRLTQAWKDAEPEYRQYLQLSNFDSGAAGKVNYYVAGYLFGMGRKRRAAQADIWKEMHSEANFGLCECEAHQKRYDEAIGDCQKALVFDPADPFAHYRLALTFSEKYNTGGGLGLLAAARKHFDTVLELNPDIPEADKARKYIQNIDSVLGAISK
jgi:tetratricopeptide (TPR) repeat protein